MAKCEHKCEVYSRVVGYYRPVADWNVGKKEEFTDRRTFNPCREEKSEAVQKETALSGM